MTKEELAQIEEWAELPFTNDELAVIIEVSPAEIRVALHDDSSPIGNAIKRGRLKTRAEFYKQLIKLSNQGSGPAQTLLHQYLQRTDP